MKTNQNGVLNIAITKITDPMEMNIIVCSREKLTVMMILNHLKQKQRNQLDE